MEGLFQIEIKFSHIFPQFSGNDKGLSNISREDLAELMVTSKIGEINRTNTSKEKTSNKILGHFAFITFQPPDVW